MTRRSQIYDLALNICAVMGPVQFLRMMDRRMLISAFAALALFAAPEAAQSGGAETAAVPPAETQPATKKVCTTIQVSGSNLPKKRCRTVPVKAETPKPTEEASAKSETTASQ